MKKDNTNNPYATLSPEPVKAIHDNSKKEPVSSKITSSNDMRVKAGK